MNPGQHTARNVPPDLKSTADQSVYLLIRISLDFQLKALFAVAVGLFRMRQMKLACFVI